MSDFNPVGKIDDFQPVKKVDIDTSTGAPFGQRAAASVKISPEGKLNYLKSIYGPENVQMIDTEAPTSKALGPPSARVTPRPSDAGFVYKNPKTGKWTLFDEKGPGWSDVADMAGGALEAAPAAVVGAVTQNPGWAAAASGAGNALRQGVSAMIPGEENMGMGERALQVGTSAALGGATQGGANLLTKGIDKYLRPQNILRKYIMKRGSTPVVAEGEQIARDTGVELSAGQITGNRDILAIESYLRQSPLSRNMFFEKDVARAKQFENYFEGVLTRVSPDRLGKEATGERVAHAYGKYLESLIELRSKVGGKAFDDFSNLAGGGETMPIGNAIAAIDGVVDDVYTRFGTDSANQVVEGLKKLRGKLVNDKTGEVSMLTPKEFQRSLSIYSKAAHGSGDVIKDLDKATNKMIATRVYQGLLKDLDEVADMPGDMGAAGESLRSARDTWKQLSGPIDNAKQKVLAKTLKMVDSETGAGGEKVVDKFAGTSWTPSQLRDSMKIIESVDPLAAKNIRAEILESIWNKAEYSGSKKAIGGGTISPAKLSTAAAKSNDYVKAVFAGDQGGFEAWQKVIKAAGRMSDEAGMGGSQTAPFQLIDKLITSGWGSARRVAMGDIIGPATDLAKVLTPRKFAKVMLDRDARHNLMTLVQTGPKTKAGIAAAQKVYLFAVRDDVADYLNGETGDEQSPNTLAAGE